MLFAREKEKRNKQCANTPLRYTKGQSTNWIELEDFDSFWIGSTEYVRVQTLVQWLE